MIRTVAKAAVLLGAALLSVPGTAVAADRDGDAPLVVINNVHQYAGGDIFEVGRDNFVGSGNGNGAAQPSGVGTPGATTAVVRIVTGYSVPNSGVPLVSHEGSGDYPRALYPAYNVQVPIDGSSSAVYRTEDSAGTVAVNATVGADGRVNPGCTAEGTLVCRVDYDGQGNPFLKVDGR
ncbi:hypothetical protein [Streptomyces sp. NPDC002580]|uniref:hypothetical protein n=1 Tax=Streptomyces sp. NPDC002580 TaxID=3364653 RepID=UPI0036776345